MSLRPPPVLELPWLHRLPMLAWPCLLRCSQSLRLRSQRRSPRKGRVTNDLMLVLIRPVPIFPRHFKRILICPTAWERKSVLCYEEVSRKFPWNFHRPCGSLWGSFKMFRGSFKFKISILPAFHWSVFPNFLETGFKLHSNCIQTATKVLQVNQGSFKEISSKLPHQHWNQHRALQEFVQRKIYHCTFLVLLLYVWTLEKLI